MSHLSRSLVLTGLVAFFISTPLMGQQNLLLNPSFESGSGITADDWGNFSPSSGTTQRTTAFAHAGNYSFRFSSTGYTEFPHSNSSSITAIPGATYAVSMWGLYDVSDPLDSTHSADCKAIFYDSQSNQLSFTESYFLTSSDPSDTWKQANYTLTAPANAAILIVQVGVAAGTYSNSAVYFDDGSVSLTPVISLSASAPTLFGSSQGSLTVSGGNGKYTPASLPLASTSQGYVSTTAWNPTTDTEIYALKISDSAPGNLNSDLTALANEVNSGNYSGFSVTSSTTDPTGGLLTNTGPGGFNFFIEMDDPMLGGNSNYFGFNLNQFDADSDTLTTSAIAVIPEPATGLVVTGASLLMLSMRRRRQPKAIRTT